MPFRREIYRGNYAIFDLSVNVWRLVKKTGKGIAVVAVVPLFRKAFAADAFKRKPVSLARTRNITVNVKLCIYSTAL